MNRTDGTVRARDRWTRRLLTGGALVSGICLAIAIVLEAKGAAHGSGQLTDLAGIATSVVRWEPWGWASLGVLVMMGTPAAALVATTVEYAAARDLRTAWTAVAVLAVLAVSLVVALIH